LRPPRFSGLGRRVDGKHIRNEKNQGYLMDVNHYVMDRPDVRR
jgi:hypothetical protein